MDAVRRRPAPISPAPRRGRGVFIFTSDAINATDKDEVMAKGQLRGNREAKKPKKVKPPIEATPVFAKGTPVSTAAPKKKG
ncbi:hypothetical protein GCM10017653_25200 [Ancylobacter defluvii]|uniref:Uncharacterized protein n=1 Tax=Ancylobacter defluvii TaxID=1282440 RepID=A0A9W6JV50_9HYPH|nr:hypothetical protein GCM10017653_25200 [Ancylobacter defluvii]